MDINLLRRIFSSSEPSLGAGMVKPVAKSIPMARAKVFAIGGGKGGVGKSFISSNLGILLTRLGKKVLVVDADLGAANLHTFFAAEGSKQPLSNFLKGEIHRIEEIVSKSMVPNLDLVSGAKDSLDVADMGGRSISRLHAALKGAEYDYILLDTGPGTSSSLLDLFLLGDEGIIVTTPEPTSIENSYRFIKCLVLRKIKKVLQSDGDEKLKGLLMNAFNENGTGNGRTIRETFERMKILDQKEVRALIAEKDSLRVSIIVNQARRPEDKALGHLMRRACRDFFGIDVNFAGHISYEESVYDSIRDRCPMAVNFKESLSMKEMETCLHGLVKKQQVAI